jgi:uridine kinase
MNFVHSLALRATASFPGRARPFLIGISGWADTGKSTLADTLCKQLQHQGHTADWISTDAFLMDRDLRNQRGLTGYNPASIDADAMTKAIAALRNGSTFDYRPYDNRTGTRATHSRSIAPQAVIVIEGIHALHGDVRHLLNYIVFIDAPSDVLRDLRIQGNIKKRGMSPAEACSRVDFEWQEFEKYIAPAQQHADCVVNVTRGYAYSFVGCADGG